MLFQCIKVTAGANNGEANERNAPSPKAVDTTAGVPNRDPTKYVCGAAVIVVFSAKHIMMNVLVES
jgi:hypothetical protein